MQNIKISHKIALIIAIITSIWIFSGLNSKKEIKNESLNLKQEKFKVTTTLSQAIPYSQTIELYGYSKADKKIMLKTEINGKINKILKKEGDILNKGETLILLDKKQYQASYNQAKANYNSSQTNFQTIKALFNKKLASKTEYNNSKAEFSKREAELKIAKINLENTEIKAPFSGIIEKIYVEEGEIISAYNTSLANFINDTNIIITSYIPEKLYMKLKNISKTEVEFLNDVRRIAAINYISNESDSKTKTFEIELIIDNFDSKIKDGMTAKTYLTIENIPAHKIKSSSLSIDDQGNIGIKIIKDNIVEFRKADILHDAGEYIYINNIEPELEIITIGHGMVEIGEIVSTEKNTK
jgi:multidrug efflux system membrane fusion protein